MRSLSIALVFVLSIYIWIFAVGIDFQIPAGHLSQSEKMWSHVPQSNGILSMIKRAKSFSIRCDGTLVQAGLSAQSTFAVGLPLYYAPLSEKAEKLTWCSSPELIIDTNTRDWILASLLRS